MRPQPRVLLLVTLWLLPSFTHASGLTPPPDLHRAVSEADRSQVEVLLSQGADIEERDAFARTALHLAARRGDQELVRELLGRGADVDAINLGGMTPLHVAVAKGHTEVARLLLANCADVDARDRQRRTPLHIAAARGHADTAQLLIENRARLEARLASGQTAFATAIAFQQPETVAFLRSELPLLPAETTVAENGEILPAVAAAPERSERPRGTEGTTRFVQEKLTALGYDPGPASGQRSARTLEAVRAFQDAIGVVLESERGRITRCLVDRLTVESERRERRAPDRITGR